MTTIPADTPDWLPAEQGATDTLLPYALYPLNAGTNDYSAVITCSKSYQAVVLRIQPPSTANNAAYTIVVQALDPTGNQYYAKSVSWSVNYSEPPTIVLPIPLTVGGALQFTIYAPTSGVSLYMSISGCTATLVQGSMPVRSDGRPYPLGTNVIGASFASGATIIGAPGAGQRIMLRDLSIGNGPTGSGAQSGSVKATVGGNVVQLVTASVAASGVPTIGEAKSYHGGLLLDDDTAVTTSYSAAITFTVEATYDIVS